MKNILILALLIFGGVQAWQKFNHGVEPIYDTPYIAVYGRSSCGFTKKMLSDLKRSGSQYHYFIVDEQPVADSLHARMEAAGISTRRYNLPVVDVNGSISIRPDSSDVVADYRASL